MEANNRSARMGRSLPAHLGDRLTLWPARMSAAALERPEDAARKRPSKG